MLRRWRVKRAGEGRIRLHLPDEERELLRHLLPQLRALVSEDPDPTDERARRLFPTAYADDPERDAEYQHYMREELVTSRVKAIDQVEASLDATELDEGTALGWVQSLNAIRLVLGTMLDVGENTDLADIPQDDPDLANFALYGYLSALLDEMIQALDPR